MSPSPTRPWDPDQEVGEALCRRLLRAQFPELAEGPLQRLGEGWCNEVFRVGDVTWRFPRQARAVPALEAELRVLPWLAPESPVPIPHPQWVGRPAEGYPFPFYGHPHLPGRSVDGAPPSEAARGALAARLGAWLGWLHGIEAGAVAGLEVPDGAFRADLERRQRVCGEFLADARAVLPEDLGRALEEALGGPALEAYRGDGVLLHGDLYARHLLLDEAGDWVGVIDWEDVCWGDPAADLCLATTFLPPAAQGAFLEAYGEVDAATWARARRFGWTYVAALGAYARRQDDEGLADEVRRAARYLGG